MSSLHLQIVTPDGLFYDGQAERLTVRTVNGDSTILANHVNYVAALGMGAAEIVMDGRARKAACIGGMLAVTGGEAKLIATTFEWADELDAARAKQALADAEQLLSNKDALSEAELQLAEAKLKRALVRTSLLGS